MRYRVQNKMISILVASMLLTGAAAFLSTAPSPVQLHRCMCPHVTACFALTAIQMQGKLQLAGRKSPPLRVHGERVSLRAGSSPGAEPSREKEEMEVAITRIEARTVAKRLRRYFASNPEQHFREMDADGSGDVSFEVFEDTCMHSCT